MAFSVAVLIFGLIPFTVAVANDDRYVIGFPEDDLSSDWRAAQMKEVEQEIAKHKNVRLLKADAGGSVAQNVMDIEDMVAQGAQLLFLAPRNPEALRKVIPKLRSKGVKIVLLTRKLSTEDYDAFISPDDFRISYDAAQVLAEKLKGSGTILMLEGIPSTTTAQRRKEGFLAGMRNFPEIRVISKVANYSRTEAVTSTALAWKSEKKISAVFAHNDAMATGARIALRHAGVDLTKLPIVGIDYLPEARDAILAGEQLASFTYPTCGKLGVQTAIAILHGEKVPRYVYVPSQLVTRDNAAQVSPVY